MLIVWCGKAKVMGWFIEWLRKGGPLSLVELKKLKEAHNGN